MRANVGDLLVVHGHKVGQPEHQAEILEVRGEGGEPPYRVRWLGDGQEALVIPGADALIKSRRRKGSGSR